jgi:hypothetical protein
MNRHSEFTDQVVGTTHGVGSRAAIRIAATVLVAVGVAIFGVGALAQAGTDYPPGPTTTTPAPTTTAPTTTTPTTTVPTTTAPTTTVPDEPDFPPGPLTIEIGSLEFPLGEPVAFDVANCPTGEPASATFNGDTKSQTCDDAFRTGFSFPGPAACGSYALSVSAAGQSASAQLAVVDNPAHGRPCSPVAPSTTVPVTGALPGAGTTNTISMIQIGIGLLLTGAVLVGVVAVRRSRLRPA